MASGGSYFKGWVSNLPSAAPQSPYGNIVDVYTGHVLSVTYTGADAGKIRVRVLSSSESQKDDDIKTVAYPADLSIVKYPLPGELVKLVAGIKNLTSKGKFALVYYYTSILSVNDSITFNSNPYMGQTVPVKLAPTVFTPEYEHRFENKLKNPAAFIQQDGDNPTAVKLLNRRPLKPSEGDIIMQGRFGSSIRLTAADNGDLMNLLDGNSTEWSETGGKAGDSIIVMSVDGTIDEQPRLEKVDDLLSAIYISSQPTIPITLATSETLASYASTYDLSGEIQTTDDMTKFMASKPIPPQLRIIVNDGSIDVGGSLAGADFNRLVGIVIDNFEGGYWSDKWFTDRQLGASMGWPYDVRYASSGETMFGIDRRNGGTLNTGPSGIEFWNLIDQQNASTTWRWNYMGGAVGPRLKELVGGIMQPHYTKQASRKLSQQAFDIVNSDPRLIIHFVYASWNGSGWFAKFATDINNAVNSGIFDKNKLVEVALNSRINEGYKPGDAPVSLIKQGGLKMQKIFQNMT